MTIKQLPDFAFRSATDYASAMDQTHARYDPVLGAAIVDVMERLSLFAVFRSPWFSLGLVVLVTSIIVCTLDRTPRLWRGVSDIRVAQPEPYFDPRLPDRAAMDGVAPDDVRGVLRTDGLPRPRGDRRPTGRVSSTATGTSTRRWRPCSRTPGSSCSSSRPRRRPGSATSRVSSSPRARR